MPAKVSLKNYTKPRPIWMMVVGDTCIYAGSIVTANAVALDAKFVAYCSLFLMVAGFFFSKLFVAIDKERQVEIEETVHTTLTKKVETITQTSDVAAEDQQIKKEND